MRRLLAALLLSLLPATALAGSTLESQVAQATWPRTVSGTLQSVAAVRVIEIQTTFAHRPMPELVHWSWGEVIAYNSGYADPIAQTVVMWRNSPTHWNILTGSYTHIGCASDWAGSRFYAVCLFGIPPAGGGVPPPPAPYQPITDVLTDTAAADERIRIESLLMLFSAGGMLLMAGYYAATEWALHEKFLDLNPEIRHKYDQWRRQPDPHVCPRHHLKVKPGQPCRIERCDWKSPE